MVQKSAPTSLADGKYLLRDTLGEGGFGRVYLGQHRELERDVAIKVLHPELMADDNLAERFRREALANSRLQHRNIVQVLDFGEDDEHFYIVMEFLDGQSLFAALLESGGAFTLERIVHLTAQITAALAVAHDAGIIHRDMKPENVMLVTELDDESGRPTERVKVCDFGLAKIRMREQEPDAPSLTGVGEINGTPAFMSPEQAQGLPIDHRSDIYSVGIMLFQMTTGQMPFHSETPVGLLMQHITREPPFPSEINPNIPSGLESIIIRALAKEPGKRFQHVREMRNALLDLLHDPSLLADLKSGSSGLSFDFPVVGELDTASRDTLDAPLAAITLPPASTSPRKTWPIAVIILASVAITALLAVWIVTDGSSEESQASTQPDNTAASPSNAPVLTTLLEPERVPPSQNHPLVHKAQTPLGAPREASPPESPKTPETGQPDGTNPAANSVPAKLETEVSPPGKTDPPKEKPRTARNVNPETKVETTEAASETLEIGPGPKPETEISKVPDKTPVETTHVEPKEPPLIGRASASVVSFDVNGSLGLSAVKRTVASSAQIQEFEQCYQKASHSAKRDQNAKLNVKLDVDVDGRVRNVSIQGDALPGMTDCLKNALSGLRTRERPDTGGANATFSLHFQPGS